MKTLRRYHLDNRDYFITAVTFNREEILLRDIQLFWKCRVSSRPIAWVILPDHFHITINTGDKGISTLIHSFKITYARRYRDKHGPGRVWQNRFWDHLIRDQDDFNRHLDYIHYNPVKHGLTSDPFTYEYSSLNGYYQDGLYQRDWGVKTAMSFDEAFGE